MPTTYTIIIKHNDFSISDFYIDKSFELSDHAAALEYVISNLSETMVIEVMKKVSNTSGFTTEYSPVTSTNLPKYVQAKVKGLVVFAKHISHVQLAMKETECCVIYISKKCKFGWCDINNEYVFNNAVCDLITSYCVEYGYNKLKFEVVPAYTDKQLETHINNRTLNPICWAGTVAPWHYAELKEQEELAALKAELNNTSEPKPLTPEDQADYDRQIASERAEGCMDDPQDKIKKDIEVGQFVYSSLQAHSKTEKTVPSFGPDQQDEYWQSVAKKSKRAGQAFNISADEWDTLRESYGYYKDENSMAWCFSGFLVHETNVNTQIMQQYNLNADEWIDIKEQFEWFCADFGYNIKNNELFLSYVKHWVSVNHSGGQS